MKKVRIPGIVLVLVAVFLSILTPVHASSFKVQELSSIDADQDRIPPEGIGPITLTGSKKVGSVLRLKNDFIQQHPDMFTIKWMHGCGFNQYKIPRATKFYYKVGYKEYIYVIATLKNGIQKGSAFSSVPVLIKGARNCEKF